MAGSSVLVTPAIAIGVSTIAAATVLDTTSAHGLVSGDTALVAGHVGSTPAIDGTRIVTVIDATHVSIPVAVTIPGAGGTLTKTLGVEPLTLAEGKLRAGLDWTSGDARDALMLDFISAARAKLEKDTGLSCLTQIRDVSIDAPGAIVVLPDGSRPLQAVTSVTAIDTDGVSTVVDVAGYVVDLVTGTIALAEGGSWPTALRTLRIRIVSGYTAPALFKAAKPSLYHALALLVAHYATAGRDAITMGAAAPTPLGYEDALAGDRRFTLA